MPRNHPGRGGRNPDKVVTQGPCLLIERLPTELILQVSSHLTQKARCHIGRTCRALSTIFNQELYLQDVKNGDRKALWYACETQDTGLLHRLLRYNASLNLRTIIDTPFHFYHLAPARRALDTLPSPGLTPLAVAIRAGSQNIVKELLQIGADANGLDSAPEAKSMYCRRPVHWTAVLASNPLACRSTIRKIVGYLFNHGADLDALPVQVSGPDGLGLEGPAAFQTVILDHVPSVHSETTEAKYNKEYLDALVNRWTLLDSLLSYQARTKPGDQSLAERLVVRLMNEITLWYPYFPFDESHWSPHESEQQMELAHRHVRNLLKLLIGYHGSELLSDNAYADAVGSSPLHQACMEHPVWQVELVNLFLDNGSPINKVDGAGQTPLITLCRNQGSNTDLIELLIARGADVDHQDGQGSTALHYICSSHTALNWRFKVARSLVSRGGADITKTDGAGRTAVVVARQTQLHDIAKYLKSVYRETVNPKKKKTQRKVAKLQQLALRKKEESEKESRQDAPQQKL